MAITKRAIKLLVHIFSLRSAIAMTAAFSLMGCLGGGSSQSNIDLASAGIKLEVISGNNQVTAPLTSWGLPLKVRVASGLIAIKGIPITFSNETGSDANIVNETVITDSDGYAQTGAVAPNLTNQTLSVRASMPDGSYVVFTLQTRSFPDTPTMTMQDPVTLSQTYAKQTGLLLDIVDVGGVAKWCVSEQQTSRPNLGTETCVGGAGPSNGWYLSEPLTYTLSASNGAKTVFIWVADSFESVSLFPSSASIYLDTVAPGQPFITLTDPGSGSTTDTSAVSPNMSITNDGDASYWCVVAQLNTAPAPTAPTRTDACWSAIEPTSVTLPMLGLNKVYVWTKDLAGNVSPTVGVQIINFTTIAITDPTLAVKDPTTNSTTYARQSTTTVTIGADLSASKWCLSETQNYQPPSATSTCDGGTGPYNGWLATRPTSYSFSSGDGVKTLYLWVANPLNTTSAGTIAQNITIDTVPPAIAIVDAMDPNTGQSAFTNQSTVTLSITGDTDATSWCVIERASNVAPPSLPAWNNGCWVTTRPTQVTLAATGTRRIYVYTKDVAENVAPSPAVGMISYTTTPPANPVLVLRDSVTNSTTLTRDEIVTAVANSPSGTVRWCLSETQSTKPATGTDVCNGGEGASSGWHTSSPTTYTVSSGDGAKTLYLWVADAANNVNATASSATITLDKTAPATPTIVIRDPNSNSSTDTNQIIANLSITGDTDAVRWCRIMQAPADPAPSTPLMDNVCWVLSRPSTVVMDVPGTRKLYLYTMDAAGNVGTAGTAQITYSVDPPVDPTIVLADATTTLTTYARSTSASLAISNDTDAVRWCVSETQSSRPLLGTATCNGGVGTVGNNYWSTTRPTTWTLSSGDAVKRVYVWTANAANSVNANPSSASITLDTAVPAAPTIAMTDPNTASATDTNQSTVSLAISGEAADVTAWCVLEQAAATAAPAQPTFADACWTTSKPVTATLGAVGSRKVYVYLRDRAYNITAAATTATISYSTTVPADATLALTDPTTSSTSHVRQSTIGVSITGDTNAVKWCLSETQTTRPSLGTSTCTGGTGASSGWLTSRPTSFALSSGDATKTVYVWTADASNNVSSATVTDAIALDSLPPAVAFVTLSDTTLGSTSVTNQTPANMSIQFDTDATAWCPIEQAFATAAPSQPAWNDACWVGVRPTTQALGATGIRRVFVYTKDVAHNVSPAPGVSQINYTTTPPSDPTLSLSNPSMGTTTISKDLTVTASISSPTGTVKWCLSETQTTRPANGSATCTGGAGPDSGWYTSLPSTFDLSAGDGSKSVKIWVSDTANNVSANTVSATITLDQTVPATPTVSLSDPNTGSTTQTNQFSVNLSITADTDAVKWCPMIQADADPAPATPAISDSCWRSTRPTTQLIDATGLRKLYVFTRDTAGNIGTAGTANITYSTVLPADPAITVADSVTSLSDYAKQTGMTISITGDTGAVKWCLSESQSTRPALGTSTCTGGTGPSNGWLTARPTTFTLSSGEALKRIYIWTADVSNNVNANSTSATITLDTTAPAAPSVAMSDPNTTSSTDTNQSTANLTIGTTADALAWCTIEQAAATAAPSAPAFGDVCFVTTKPTTQDLGATGSRKVYVYTRDRAYNVAASAGVATISFSTTAPVTATLALSDATTTSTSYVRQLSTAASITGDTDAVKWCLSESQTTRPALGTSACTGGTGASNGWLTARPTSFALSSGDGAKTVYLWTADVANNTSATAATDAITLDTSTPSIPTVSMSDPNTGNTAFTNVSTVDLSITNDTDATSWCVFEQALASAAPSAPLYNNACWVTPKPTQVSLTAEGDRRVYIYTKDDAHNISVAAAVSTISYSTSAPSDPVLVLSNSVTGSRLYTNDPSVAVSINNPAGAVKWCISESQSSRPANGTTTCTGGAGGSNGWYTSMPSTITLSTGDALKTVYIWVADASNNTNTNSSSTTITLIETPLSAPTVALADPNTSSATETNQSSVDMTVTSDSGATAWCAIAQAAAAATPSTPAVSSTCWTLTRPTSVALGATGSRAAYVFLRDPAMNVSAAGSATIALSTTPPADPTLSIAHATTGLTTYAKTTALAITIGNDATATRWCVSESQSVKPQLGTSTCVGGSGGSSGWYTARPTTFTLSSGDGNKRVYVWVANSSNNVSDTAVSQTIVLDTDAPGALTISGVDGGGDTIADQYLGTTTTATLHWSAASGASVYKTSILLAADDSVVCAEQTTAALSYTFAGCTLVDGTSYKAVVTAYDSAENTTAASNTNFAFAVSLTPPGAFSITGAYGSQDATADQWSGTSLPTVAWGASAGVYQYIVQVLANDGVTVMCTQQVKSAASLSHDFSTTGCSALANDTNFKIDVIAKDVAGNSRTASNNSFVFRTDTTSPVVSISSTPASQAIVNTAAFVFAATDSISGVLAVDCRRDGGAYAACDTVTDKSYTGLAEGAHTFDVRVTDNVGLTHTASYSWAIDTVAPGSFSISGATGATDSTIDNELRNDNKIIAHWTDSANEDYYEVTILNAADDSVACPMVTKAANSTSHSFSSCVLDTNDDFKIKVVAKRGYGTQYAPTPMTITTPTDTITATVSLAASVASGSGTTVTLVTYLNGVQLTTGGLNPTFSLTGAGTSTGTFGAVSYIGSGTYQATFTGVLAGTAVDITATSGGTAFASVTTDAIAVTPGPVSAATSLVALSQATVVADNADLSNITVTLKDAAGNLITGKTVTASHAGGTSTGVISSFTDNTDGTYSGTFSGRVVGTATTITAVGDGTTITQTQNIIVFAGPPVKISATGPTSLTAHLCAGPYTVTLRDYWNNLASALSNVQINFGGIGGGNYSLLSDCTATVTSQTIFLGGSTAPPIYAMARAPAASQDLTFTDNAASLTAGTLTVAITGVPAWIGVTGSIQFGATSGLPSRSNLDGLQNPRGVWVDETTNIMYVTDQTNHRIVRYDLTTQEMTGWIGRVLAIDGLAGTGCTTLTTGQATPGWCTGGTSQASGGTVLDNMFNNPVDITGDGTYLYISDNSNHRIVRVTISTGAFAGWYGRVNGVTSLGGAAGCSTTTTGNATPGWCTGGTSQASAGTNWDGKFNSPLSVQYYLDGTDGKLLFVVDASNHRIVRLNVNHATTVNFDGWLGRPTANVPTGNGVNYPTAVPGEQCTALTSTSGTRFGYCVGGTTQASPTGSTVTAGVSNYDGMFNTPRGLAIIGTDMYVSDTTNNRYIRFAIQSGAANGWAGRSTFEYPATGGGGSCGTYNALTFWCTGGAPIWTNYCYPACVGNTATQSNTPRYTGSLFSDGTYLYTHYSANGDQRILKSEPLASPFTYTWVGRIGANPSTGTGCSTTSLGFPTPVWCGGGSASQGYYDGHFRSPGEGYADVTHDRMYTPDQTLNKVQIHVLSTGAPAGWIGAKAVTSPTNWLTSYTPGLLGNAAYPDDLSFAAGSGIAAMAGLAIYGGEMYVADTGNTRLKRYNANTGAYLGWFGRTSVVPTGPDDTCTGISSGAVTPIWCTGGTSQGIATGGTGELGAPRGLAADSGYIYIADTSQNRVARITRTAGSFAGWIGRTGTSPTGMSGFDAGGTAICPTLGSNTFTGAWCAGGNLSAGTLGDGGMSGPYGVAVDVVAGTNTLFVADTSNHRVNAYNATTGEIIGWLGRVNIVTGLGGMSGCSTTTTGNSTPAWCTGGTAQASGGTANFSGFNAPRGVAIASVAGTMTLFVADTAIHRVHKINAVTGAAIGWIGRVNSVVNLGGMSGCSTTTTGNPTPAWCTGGSSQVSGTANWDGGFSSPSGLWSDGSYLYVVDSGNERVTKHNAVTGAFVGWRGTIATLPTGGEAACTAVGVAVGQVTGGWCTGGTSRTGRALGGFQGMAAISGDSNFIYLTDSLNNRIAAFPK